MTPEIEALMAAIQSRRTEPPQGLIPTLEQTLEKLGKDRGMPPRVRQVMTTVYLRGAHVAMEHIRFLRDSKDSDQVDLAAELMVKLDKDMARLAIDVLKSSLDEDD